MAEITLSSAVRTNLLSLQNTASLLGTTQERLSTGLKVNSALDDPTAFFTASALNSRAGDLSRLQDFTGNAVQTIKAADEGITAIQSLVESAEAAARQALQSAGSTARVQGSVNSLTSSTLLTSLGAADTDVIKIADGTTTNSFTVTTTTTVGDLVDSINNNSSLEVKASLTGDGSLKLEATGTKNIVIDAETSAGADKDAIETGLGFTAGTGGEIAAAGTASTDRASLATQFNDLRTQINELAKDASFNGVNLLDGDSLTVTFNEDSSSTLSISGVTYSASGLGISAAADTFQTDKNIDDALAELKTAATSLRSQAATFGSNLSIVETRQDFTKNLINVLETGAANLTLADTNEEAANALALQTRQSLSSTSLRLASQADQSVLQLLR